MSILKRSFKPRELIIFLRGYLYLRGSADPQAPAVARMPHLSSKLPEEIFAAAVGPVLETCKSRRLAKHRQMEHFMEHIQGELVLGHMYVECDVEG